MSALRPLLGGKRTLDALDEPRLAHWMLAPIVTDRRPALGRPSPSGGNTSRLAGPQQALGPRSRETPLTLISAVGESGHGDIDAIDPGCVKTRWSM
jgi:hypothetical protein